MTMIQPPQVSFSGWKNKIKESETLGRIDTQHVKINDLERIKRISESDALPKIVAFEVYTNGQFIFGYETIYADGKQTGHHIAQGINEGVKCVRFDLE